VTQRACCVAERPPSEATHSSALLDPGISVQPKPSLRHEDRTQTPSVSAAATNTEQARRRHGLCSMLLLPAVSGSINRLAFHAPLLLEPPAGAAAIVDEYVREVAPESGVGLRRRILSCQLESESV